MRTRGKGEGKGEERREKGRREGRRGENGESGTKSTPLSPDAFPSMGLGNNITPIKGKLGKSTTPTGRGPSELNAGLESLSGPPAKTTKP